MSISDKVKSVIRDVKDFPTPGIIFKDITPVFNHPELVREMVKELCANQTVEARRHYSGLSTWIYLDRFSRTS